MKKIKNILSIILFLFAGGSIITIATILLDNFQSNELNDLSVGFEIGFYFFTISIGALGLIKYWDSVEAKRDETNWTKYKILDEKYNDFVKSNNLIITSLEWQHKFEKISDVCQKEKRYRKSIEQGEKIDFEDDDILVIEQLDRFLDFFENLYFAVSKKILDYSDLQMFFHYHIITLNEYYEDEKYKSFRNYIDNYYFNIDKFLSDYKLNIKS